jgi:hypothetical protein
MQPGAKTGPERSKNYPAHKSLFSAQMSGFDAADVDQPIPWNEETDHRFTETVNHCSPGFGKTIRPVTLAGNWRSERSASASRMDHLLKEREF